MTNETNQNKGSKQLSRWYTLSDDEKKREFVELAHSPYWDFLPADIQRRIIRLLPQKHHH